MFSRMLARKPRLTFWQWLEQNQSHILQLLKEDPKAGLMKIADSFEKQYRDLVLEVTYDAKSAKCVLTLSPCGDRRKYQHVLDLAASAPILEHFEVVAFKQRKPAELMEHIRLTIGHAEIATEDTFFSAQRDADKLHIRVHLTGYDGSPCYKAGGFTLIEGLIGEIDLDKYIGAIQFTKLEQQHLFSLDPLWKLPVMVDDLKMRLSRNKEGDAQPESSDTGESRKQISQVPDPTGFTPNL